MGSGQTMLTAAFFVLVTVSVMSANRMILNSMTDVCEQEALEQGSAFANALLSEILTKSYDSFVDYSSYPPSYQLWAAFDAPSALGPGTAIKAPDVVPYKSIDSTLSPYNYNDVDDYNGYERSADSQDIQGFRLKVSVYYVTKANPETNANTQTYFKRVDVTVTQPQFLKDGIKFSALACY